MKARSLLADVAGVNEFRCAGILGKELYLGLEPKCRVSIAEETPAPLKPKGAAPDEEAEFVTAYWRDCWREESQIV